MQSQRLQSLLWRGRFGAAVSLSGGIVFRVFRPWGLASLLSCVASFATQASPLYTWAHPQPQGNPVHDLAFADDLNGFAVGEFGTVLRTIDGGTTWELVSDVNEFAAHLHAIVILPDGDLLAAGSAPGLFHSDDGGASWTAVPNPSTGTLFGLDRDPSGRLDACGENGSVIRSTDGGASWISIGMASGAIADQHWKSAQEGFVVGKDAAHRTTNGGQSWTAMFESNPFGYRDIYFTDSQHGFVTADFEYWMTTDGGSSWTSHDQFVPPLYRHETLVLDANHWFTVTHLEGAELWETTDGGGSWTLRLLSEALGFVGLTRLPNGRLITSSSNGDLYYSDDGVHFTNATHNLDGGKPAPIEAIGATPGGTLFAVNTRSSGAEETWMRSDDGGRTWFLPAASPDLNRVVGICFIDDLRGVVGAYEQIRYTTNGGESWLPFTLPDSHRASDFDAVGGIIYLGTSKQSGGGGVFRSLDGGASWEPRSTGLPSGFSAFSIDFLDVNAGYVAGHVNGVVRLYRTTNGGSGWTAVAANGVPAVMNDIRWLDAQVGLAALLAHGIYRTTDGGVSWSQVSTIGATDLNFRDSMNGFASSSYWNPKAQQTNDAGLTWTVLTPPITDPTFVLPTAEGFVMGAFDTCILHAANSDPSAVEPSNRSAARLFLHAPRPNPGLGVITLAWTSLESLPVSITVHSADGRLVRRLDGGRAGAGDHEARWDGLDDAGRPAPSGAYFARASDGHTTATQRFVYLRND